MATFDQNKAESELNQYWYSDETIKVMVSEIEMHATAAAFLSTPSLYFALTKDSLRANSKVFEYDRQWEKDPGFVFYDFNKPEHIPANLWGAFDYVVIDPPFITREVWSKYAATLRLIAAPKCKVFFTSVIENQQMLEELIDASLIVPVFRPSIPKLTYQYHCFTNYDPTHLNRANPELPPEDDIAVQARRMANDLRESQNAFKQQMQSRDRQGEAPLPTHQRAEDEADGKDPAMKWNHVPAGLTEYPEEGTAAPAVPPSAAYLALERRRADMTTLRGLVDDVIKASEGMLKPFAVLANAASTDAKKAVATEELAQLSADKASSIAKILAVTRDLEAGDPKDAKGVCSLMATFVADWSIDFKEKGTYMEKCADATRLYKSPIFNRQKELLAEMKAQKKKDAATVAA